MRILLTLNLGHITLHYCFMESASAEFSVCPSHCASCISYINFLKWWHAMFSFWYCTELFILPLEPVLVEKVVSLLTFLSDTGVPWSCWGSANLSLEHHGFVLAFLHISISAHMKQWASTFLHELITALLWSVLTHPPCALFYRRLATSPACLDEALFY